MPLPNYAKIPEEQAIAKHLSPEWQARAFWTVEGDLADFLGVNIDRRYDGSIHSQPHLIDQILEDLRLKHDTVKIRTTPAASSKLLTRHSDSQSFDNSFNYRSVIGKLNYLKKATRSDDGTIHLSQPHLINQILEDL